MRARLAELVRESEGFEVVRSTGTMIALERTWRDYTFDLWVLDVDMPAVELAAVIAHVRTRQVPILLVCERNAEPWVRAAAVHVGAKVRLTSREGLDRADAGSGARLRTQLRLLQTEATTNRRSQVRGEGSGITSLPLVDVANVREPVRRLTLPLWDCALLFGSSGTPEILQEVLPHVRELTTPLVLAVHHNFRFTQGFVSMVEGLTPVRVELLRHFNALFGADPNLFVVPADDGDSPKRDDGIGPNLDRVLQRVAAARVKPLVFVASGMGEDGISSLHDIRKVGGGVVALSPDACPQPRMAETALTQRLASVALTLAEFIWLLVEVTGRPCHGSGDRPRSASQ